MIHHKQSTKAKETLPGYDDHRTAVKQIAEEMNMDPKEVDRTIRFFFKAAFMMALRFHWTVRIRGFLNMRPEGVLLRKMRHRLKKEAGIRIVNKKSHLS
ncbi:MAG TPA: hypothetical protein P5522_09815 [Spirochaetia bacterium]|nr:hypothetical protein [Spirochaetia bacterium]